MFIAKALEKVSNGKGSWESTRIGIFQNDTQVGEFLRNYSCFGEQTFYPFKREDKWYALYSPNYTAIRIMSLPDCRDIGGEEPASFGFCPVEIYIPEFQWAYRKGLSEDNLKKYPEQNHSWLSRDAEEKEYDPDLFNKDLDENHKFVYKEKETFFENFAFVAGCVWGDDRSMKIELRDITLAHEGIIKPVKDWGYYDKKNKNLKATPKQLTIYEIVIFTLLKLDKNTRELLSLRNFPDRRTIKDLHKLYSDITYNQLKYRYRLALFDACTIINETGIEKLISKNV